MDILEEIDVFLSVCQLTQDESNNLVFNGITGCFESKYLADWFVNQINFGWKLWQAAKAQAVPEKDAVIKKLSDQLYEQEMKTSAARVLCETACELLDDYAHQDAMVILNDLEQAMSTGASQ